MCVIVCLSEIFGVYTVKKTCDGNETWGYMVVCLSEVCSM